MHMISHKLSQEAKSMLDIQYIPMTHNKIQLIINDHPVLANVCKTAKKYYHSIQARRFLQEKYYWSDTTIDNTWWNTHAKALRRLLLHDQIRTQKYIHNNCSTNHRNH